MQSIGHLCPRAHLPQPERPGAGHNWYIRMMADWSSKLDQRRSSLQRRADQFLAAAGYKSRAAESASSTVTMEGQTMDSTQNVRAVLRAFAAVERRDDLAFAQACQPDVELCWPPSLPYGGTAQGLNTGRRGWAAYWDPFQSPSDRGLDARVVASSEDEVVVLWHQRGRDRAGRQLDTPVLGLYQVRDGKLARGQMFYFDPASVCSFLASASRHLEQRTEHRGRTT